MWREDDLSSRHTASFEAPDSLALAQPGSYLLSLALPGAIHLQIGRLGSFDFPAGLYIYAGSAHGAGGLRARLLHHARIAARPHWHLDFLRPHAVLVGGWVVMEQDSAGKAITNAPPGRQPLECRWSQELANLPGARIPAPGFGASDCRSGCAAHLIVLPTGADPSDLIRNLLTISRNML